MNHIGLPSVLTIGFTGHRSVPDEAGTRRLILQLLTELKAGAPGIVCGVSSVAAGGDLIFAESCLELGIALRVLLPLPTADFRGDFDPATWARAERVLERALACEVTGTSGSSRDASYYECGVQTVVQSDLVIALWNGQGAQGLGGTAQVVSFARAEGRPVYWLHSDTGALERIACEHALDRDAELDFLNALPDPPSAPSAGTTPEQIARSWFSKLDASASLAAPHVRRIATLPILCTAIASISGTIASFVEGSVAWLVLGTGFGLVAGILPRLTQAPRHQTHWARIRTAAEICRSHLAFWGSPGPYTLIGPEVIPELRGVLSSLNYLKLSAEAGHEPDANAFRARYRNGRVRDQSQYFRRYADIARRKARQYSVAAGICLAIALAANALTLLGEVAPAALPHPTWTPAYKLVGTVLFQIATIVGALLAIHDYTRRRDRYREMERLLERWDRQLESAATWPVLLRVAGRIERALLAEIIEWRSLIRHRKLAQR